MLNRRGFLAAFAGMGAASAATASHAGTMELAGFKDARLRGSIDAGSRGLVPDAFDDQSKAFNLLIEEAHSRGKAIALPPGNYVVSNIRLAPTTRIVGTAGSSRLIYGGDGHLFLGEAIERLDMEGVVLDGANRRFGDHASALIDLRGCAALSLVDCDIVGSSANGIALERTGGTIERCRIGGAANVGVYSIDAKGMAIHRNTVTDCGNGGILVHRWSPGEDGTMVTNNRIERIRALAGGTGQNGNGINVFRAGNVQVAGNRIADCAFSAIRSNSGSNILVSGNTCLNSGETAIYSEFAFEGAAITGNVVDGAANGISVVNFNEGGRLATVQGNLVRNLRLTGPYDPGQPVFGIGISVEADTAVTGNVIENAPRFGINAGWGGFLRDVAISGNVVRRAGSGIAVTVSDGAGTAVISANVISDSANAIAGHDGGHVIIADLLREATRGRHRNLTIEQNRIS